MEIQRRGRSRRRCPSTSCSPRWRRSRRSPPSGRCRSATEDRGMVHIGFTAPANMSGQPSISVNAGVHRRRADHRAGDHRSPVRRPRRAPGGGLVGGGPAGVRATGLADPAAGVGSRAHAERRWDARAGSGRMTSGVTSQTPSRADPVVRQLCCAVSRQRRSPAVASGGPGRARATSRPRPDTRPRRPVRRGARGLRRGVEPRRRSAASVAQVGRLDDDGLEQPVATSAQQDAERTGGPVAVLTMRSSRSAVIAGSVTGRCGQSRGRSSKLMPNSLAQAGT